MNLSSNRITLAGFVLALALLAGVAGLGWRHTVRMQETADAVAHAHKVQAGLHRLRMLVLDVESGQLSFALTGEQAFLELFEGTVQLTLAQMGSLDRIVLDAEQRANLAGLKPLVVERIAFARRMVELRKNSGFEAARQEVLTLRGKNLTDQIRARFAQMDAREQAVLDRRAATAGREARIAILLRIGGTALGFALLVTVAALVYRETRRRQRTQEELDRFFNLSLDMLCISNADGHFKRINPAFSQTLGWSVEEMLARPFLDFVHPDDHAATLREVERQIGAGENVLQFENRYRHKDGSWHVLSWKSAPQPAGGLLYAVARDVTGTKRAEETVRELNAELRRRAAQLEEANRELESFSYSVSHDLRAPLRHVQGYVDMLSRASEGRLSETAQRYLRTITAASVEMAQLIDDLLAFSRMGRTEFHEVRGSLDELVREEIARQEVATRGRNVVWRVVSLPHVQGDPDMLRLVFSNLIGNAVKYTRKRDPAEIEIGQAGEEDGYAVLFVRDNGAGFDMRYAHKLFGVFQRLHRADEFEGTGIGLATVRRIVARHGGRVWAEGAVDRGATFYFTLRLASPPPPVPAAD